MSFFRPETEGGDPEPARPGTGPNAACRPKGSSFSWRIERTLPNIPGFPSNTLRARPILCEERILAIVAGFGRKALLVLLYRTGRLLGRPSRAGFFYAGLGEEKPDWPRHLDTESFV